MRTNENQVLILAAESVHHVLIELIKWGFKLQLKVIFKLISKDQNILYKSLGSFYLPKEFNL